MRARDIMTEGVVCLDVGSSVYDAAELMVSAGVSALPVVDPQGKMVGIVSEADLIRRAEIGTVPRKSFLSRLLADPTTGAHDFVHTHSRRVSEVMTRRVVTADEDSSLSELAAKMEEHGIKRVPILRDGALVGIVSRANLLRALLSREGEASAPPSDDAELRRRVVETLDGQSWRSAWPVNVVASDGVIHLWGFVSGDDVRDAYRVAAENVPGVRKVRNHLRRIPATIGMGT